MRKFVQEPHRFRMRTESDQRDIDRAKAFLMRHDHMTESEAYRHLQKVSMDAGRKMAETAQMVLMFAHM